MSLISLNELTVLILLTMLIILTAFIVLPALIILIVLTAPNSTYIICSTYSTYSNLNRTTTVR